MAGCTMPDTEVSRMVDLMDMRNFVPGTSHMVNVTHINHPKDFYVQLASLESDLSSLEKPGDSMTDAELIVSKRVIFKSGILRKFVRGDIESVLSEETGITCTIFAVDYGCRETLVPKHLIYVPYSDIYCPPLALHCELYMCEPLGKQDTFDEEVIDTMKYYIGKQSARITIQLRVQDKFAVVLRTYECPDDVGKTLALLNYTQMMSVFNQANRFQGISSVPKINNPRI